MDKIRLQKFISGSGIMSRRAAEDRISAGKVTVNGVVAQLGDKVDPGLDVVYVNGKKISGYLSSDESRFTYIALNKPVGYVTTMSDEQNRKTVVDLIRDTGIRLYPVGRLDMYSSGLIICTNDGDLTNKLTHPSHEICKKYKAYITSHLSEKDIENLQLPIEIDGYLLKPFEVRLLGYAKCGNADFSVVEFTLHEGRNREIRKICAYHGCELARLVRVSIGEIELGSLESGKWRYLTNDEVEYLKKIR